MTNFTAGDVSGSQTLTDDDHLYPVLFNELRTAASSGLFVTVGFDNSSTYVCDGTADDVQIQAAITSLAATGGTIYLKKGNYDITAQITIGTSNIHIIGEGDSTLLTLADNVNYSVIVWDFIANLGGSLQNLKIDGNKANNTSPTGGTLNDGVTLYTSGVTVRNVTLYNCYQMGIDLEQASNCHIENNVIDSCGQAIRVNALSHDNIIRDNNIVDCDFGIFVYDNGSPGVGAPLRNKILYNHVLNCVGTATGLAQSAAISVTGAPYTIVKGNTIGTSASRGIECFGGSTYSIIENNIIKGCPNTFGIDTGPDSFLNIRGNHIEGCSGGIILSGNQYCIVNENYTVNNGFGGSGATEAGITLNVDGTSKIIGNIVCNNISMDNQGTPTQSVGIVEWQGTAGDYLSNNYSHNFVSGNNYGTIVVVGTTNVVQDNLAL